MALAAALGLSGCAAGTPEGQGGSGGGDIVIGATLELSGATQSIGTSYRKALELEVADLNKKGVLGGRHIRLIIRDNQTDPAKNITNVNNFIDHDHAVAIASGGCSGCTLPVTGIAEKRHVPLISLASASAITEPVAQRQYTFKISPNPDQDAAVLINSLKKKGVKSIGLLNVNNPYGQEGRASIMEEAEKAGVKIAATQQFGQDDKDMSVQVQKLTSRHPDAVIAWAVNPQAGIIAKNLKDTDFKGGLYLDAGAGAELFMQSAGAAADGTHMVFPRVLAIGDVTSDSASVRAQQSWVKKYTEKYGRYSGFASFGGDSLIMLTKAMEKAHTTEGPKLRDALETLGFDGLSGRIQNSAEQHSGLQPEALSVLVAQKGSWHIDD